MKKHTYSQRRRAFISTLLLIITCAAVLAATYTYKCPKCQLVQQYSQPSPGAKCPNDGWAMVSQWSPY